MYSNKSGEVGKYHEYDLNKMGGLRRKTQVWKPSMKYHAGSLGDPRDRYG
jgi:hypothetical protein